MPTSKEINQYTLTKPALTQITQWEQQIKHLVDNNAISEARQLLIEISQTGLLSQTLKQWQIALETPKVSVTDHATGVNFNENFQWLQKNAKNFKGKWVALQNGQLIDSHENLMILRRTLQAVGKLTVDIIFMEIER
jgi:hypothetical protein